MTSTSIARQVLGLALAGVAIASQPLSAQATRRATIAGTVHDSAARPIPDVDVVVRPVGRRARTDSAGQFLFTDLNDGAYAITARKVGFAQEQWDVTLFKSGRVDIKFVLARRQQLDTVRITASRMCSSSAFEGFECRRRAGGGLFLDYPEIDAFGESNVADLFRHIPGFRVTLRSTPSGMVPVAVPVKIGACFRLFVDGRDESLSNRVPVYTRDLMAVEVYEKQDSVPPSDGRYIASHDLMHTRWRRCGVIFYWSIWAPLWEPPPPSDSQHSERATGLEPATSSLGIRTKPRGSLP
ncbi:MAG: carboxypeptidase-like regulatory domain-containing protein [Gemmatimonadota bacterium]